MKINLSTPLKNINFSNEISSFWTEKLIGKYSERHESYSPFSRRDKFPKWSDLIFEKKTVNKLFGHIADFYRSETFEFKDKEVKNIESSMYLSIQMLDILDKNNLDISKILLEPYERDPNNYNEHRVIEFFNMYLDYLSLKNETIPKSLSTQFISELIDDKGYSSYRSIDDDVNTYFQLLKVTPKDKITYEWFLENLNIFCLIKDEDTRDLVNNAKNLNYDSQKMIHDYINNNFPQYVTENEKYYPELLDNDIFSVKRFHQSTIDIKIFPIIKKYNLNQKDVRHLSSIACECLNVIASDEFMKMIGKNIPITNIETKDHHSSVVLNFSTDTHENLEAAEKILLTALKGVFEVSQKIHLTWTEDYHTGADQIRTNMDAKFVHQYYMYHNLNDSLDTNSSKPKRNKI